MCWWNLLCFASTLGILCYISLKGPFSIHLSLGMQSPSVSFKNTYICILISDGFQYNFSNHQLRKKNSWHIFRNQDTNNQRWWWENKSLFSQAPKCNFSLGKRKNKSLLSDHYGATGIQNIVEVDIPLLSLRFLNCTYYSIQIIWHQS